VPYWQRGLLKFLVLAVLIYLFLTLVVPWLCLNFWAVVIALFLAAVLLGLKLLASAAAHGATTAAATAATE